jgi:hypothetical protein
MVTRYSPLQRHQRAVREAQGPAKSGPDGSLHRFVPELANMFRRVGIRADDERSAATADGAEQFVGWVHDAGRVAEAVGVELDGSARGGDGIEGRVDRVAHSRTGRVPPQPDVVEMRDDVEAPELRGPAHRLIVGSKESV